jgi:hypothetical protein
MQPVQITNAPLAPFMKDGVEAQPLYEFTGFMTHDRYVEFYNLLYVYKFPSILLSVRVAAFALLAFAAWGCIRGVSYEFILFEALLGVAFLVLPVWMGRIAAYMTMRAVGSLPEERYRFFEEGFEVHQKRSIMRSPYEDIDDIIEVSGSLFLIVGKQQVLVLSSDALRGRLDELTAFFEDKTGKKSAHLKPKGKK